MPMYEYRCEECGKTFEELVRGDERVRCPACDSDKAERKPSTFAACCGGAGEAEPGASAGACSTGCCPFA